MQKQKLLGEMEIFAKQIKRRDKNAKITDGEKGRERKKLFIQLELFCKRI
jgi:hypothetical protein